MSVDVVVIGGGPAGSAAARLLATWGHRVRLFTRPSDRSRGLAESLPPSTNKLLDEVGVLEAVVRAGFYRSTGNTVYWASHDARVEKFDGVGLQVFRPDFDSVILESARAAGVDIDTSDFRLPTSDFTLQTSAVPLILDCTGRAGVIARRYRVPSERRTVALVGVWRRGSAWPIPDQTHTVVETFDEGWAWSVPTAADTRHVGVMVERGRAYADVVASTRAMRALVDGAELDRVFACDASQYRSTQYASEQWLLVGDAGSFIDPLSSFGVKKALASAWMAAIAAHTCLIDSSRAAAARAFFDAWERQVYDEHVRRSRDFAVAAAAIHPGDFWRVRARVAVDAAKDDHAEDVRVAFERIRSASSIGFAFAEGVRTEQRPVIRGREIVLEPAFAAPGLEPAMRFANDVDLVALANIACRHTRVPDVYDEYCRTNPATPLPNVLSALSLLVGRRILSTIT